MSERLANLAKLRQPQSTSTAAPNIYDDDDDNDMDRDEDIQAPEIVPNQLGTITRSDSQQLPEAHSQQSGMTEVAPMEDVEATVRRSDPFYQGSKISLIDRDNFVGRPNHTFPSQVLGVSQSSSFERQPSFSHHSQHVQHDLSLRSSQAPTVSGSWPSLERPGPSGGGFGDVFDRNNGNYNARDESTAITGDFNRLSGEYSGFPPFNRTLFPLASKQDDYSRAATASKRKTDGISNTITDHYTPSPKQKSATPLHREVVNKAGSAAERVRQRVRDSPFTPTPAEKSTKKIRRSSVTPTSSSTSSRLQRQFLTPEIQQAEIELSKATERLQRAAEETERIKKALNDKELKKIQSKTEKTNLAADKQEEELREWKVMHRANFALRLPSLQIHRLNLRNCRLKKMKRRRMKRHRTEICKTKIRNAPEDLVTSCQVKNSLVALSTGSLYDGPYHVPFHAGNWMVFSAHSAFRVIALLRSGHALS